MIALPNDTTLSPTDCSNAPEVSETLALDQGSEVNRIHDFRQNTHAPILPRSECNKSLVTYDEERSKDRTSKHTIYELPLLNPSGQFLILRRWEGYVLEVNNDSIVARLVDPDRKRPDEEAEFSFAEIANFDHDLVTAGAVFYWTIGYEDSAAGSRTRASTIRFRRLPVWSASELEEAKSNAKRLLDAFK